MKRSLKQVKVGDRAMRYLVTLQGDAFLAGQGEAFAQAKMLREFVDNDGLQVCGPARFQHMKMFVSGTTWIIELEATVES
jgi:hypothetical protein